MTAEIFYNPEDLIISIDVKTEKNVVKYKDSTYRNTAGFILFKLAKKNRNCSNKGPLSILH